MVASILLVLVLSLVPPLPAAAQTAALDAPGDAPAGYRTALDLLASGDTASAVARLDEVTREHDDFGPAFLRLGSILSARAGEVETEFGGRLDAKRALERAYRLMGDDPEVLLEWGLLLRKQHVRIDAKRVLERAWEAAERRGLELPAPRRAELHYTLGRIYEAWWEDWQDLIDLTPAAASGWACPELNAPVSSGAAGLATVVVVCPDRWDGISERAPRIAERKSEERRRMLDHYRLALEADPDHVGAATHLMGHLADAGEWKEFLEVATGVVASAPGSFRSHLFLGLGLHQRGRDSLASRYFEEALARMPPEERRIFGDVTPLLPEDARERYASLDSAGRAGTADLLFRARDPLLLTDAEERRLEHYARLAWAELKYGAPASGLRGWETERGEIFIRYGWPRDRMQCCYASSGPSRGRIGRMDYWSYGPEGPNFAFRRRLTYRKSRLTEESKILADDLESLAPEAYDPVTVTSVHGFPHQLARFRGGDPAHTRVEVYAEPPVDSLEVEPGDSVETGLFVLDRQHESIWESREAVGGFPSRPRLRYGFELPEGRFRYALEARRAGPDSVPRPVARSREALEVPVFPGGVLSISDIVLADTVAPRRANATDRGELSVAPLASLRMPPPGALHLVVELYGLAADERGLARYRAELVVEDSTSRGVVARIVRGMGEILGEGGEVPRTAWERTAAVDDDRVVDWLRMELPDVAPGEYVVRLRVEDLATGEAVERTRGFEIVEAAGEGR